MKKLCLFVSSLIFFLGCFVCFGLDSFADESSHYDTGYSQMKFYINETTPSEHPPYRILTGSQGQDITAYYDNYGVNTTVKVETTAHLLDNLSYQVHYEQYQWSRQNGVDGYYVVFQGNTMIDSFNISPGSVVDGIIFKSRQAAYTYATTGEVLDDNIIDGEFPDPPMDWETGNPYDGEPNQSIPAPQFTVSGSQSGNITKSVTFLNAEYDSRAQNGRYGLIMFMKWSSIDTFYLERQGGLFSKDFKVNYGTQLPWGDLVDIYPVPEYESDIVYCPQAYFFSQDTASVNAFNTYLTSYPVANRLIHVPADYEENGGLENSFKTYLGKPSCPYNTIVFQCRYYKKMDNGKFSFGPWSTGTFYPPSQGAIFNVGSYTSSDNGYMTPGFGGGASGESDNPFGDTPGWKQEWGDTNVNYDYGSDPNPQELVNNMNSLFGFVGQVPAFIGQLFTFIPQWVIIFISVSIGLMVAIGVIKLFLG